MTERGDNNSRTDAPLSEGELVDWIDGNLAPDQAARLAQASGRVDLPARIAQMQRQRAVLMCLTEEKAPAELYDRVMAAVERDVLLGLADGQTSADAVEPRLRLASTDDGWRTRTGRVVNGNMPRLALAAGLMLMVTGLAYFGSVAWKASHKPLAPDITKTDGTNPVGPLAINNKKDAITEVDGNGAPSSSRDESLAFRSTAAPAIEAAADSALAKAREVNVDRALELAAEGRLVVRVLATKPENLARIERDVSKPRADRLWRLTREVPAAVVAAVVPAAPAPFGGPALASANAPRTALSLIGPYIGPGAALSMVTASATDPLARVRGTFLLDTPATKEQLLAVSAVFRNQLSARVIFEELPAALTVPSAPQAQDVLWWTQGPSQWVRRATLPLVVEQR